MSIEHLQDNINKYVSELFDLLRGDNRRESKVNGGFKYAAGIKHAISIITDEKTRKYIENFFIRKKILVDALFGPYRKKAHIYRCILPVTLLKACGIEPCKASGS